MLPWLIRLNALKTSHYSKKNHCIKTANEPSRECGAMKNLLAAGIMSRQSCCKIEKCSSSGRRICRHFCLHGKGVLPLTPLFSAFSEIRAPLTTACSSLTPYYLTNVRHFLQFEHVIHSASYKRELAYFSGTTSSSDQGGLVNGE